MHGEVLPSETTSLLGAERPLTIKTRIIYGFGGAGIYGAHMLVGLFFQTYLLEVARLLPSFVGVVLLLGEIADIVSTPIIGKLSDNVVTRFGRRRPWLIFASLPFGFLYFLLWNNFFESTVQWEIFAYFGTVVVFVNIVGNAVSVPYGAITPDLVSTYDQATALTQVRVMIEIIIGVFVAFFQSFMVEYFRNPGAEEPNYGTGYNLSAIVFGVLFGGLPLLAGLLLEEKERTPEEVKADTRVGFIANLRDLTETFRSRNFVMLMLMYFLCWTSIAMIQNNLLLLAKYGLRVEKQFMYLIALVQVCAVAAAFFWSKVTQWVGKRNTYFIGTSQWIVVLTLFFFLNENSALWMVYAVSAYAGMCLGVGLLLPWSMLPDVVDEDECLTHVRREGAFYSIFVLLQKIGLATALAGSSWVLGAMGYVAPTIGNKGPDQQPMEAILALKLICGPVAGVMLLISMIPMFFYTLSRSRIKELHQKREDRKKEGKTQSHKEKQDAVIDDNRQQVLDVDELSK